MTLSVYLMDIALSLFIVPTAPGNLTAKADSNHTLIVSWTYPPSLIEQITSFEVWLHIVTIVLQVACIITFDVI